MNIAYNVDCMEYMRTLPDKAFDLAEGRFFVGSVFIVKGSHSGMEFISEDEVDTVVNEFSSRMATLCSGDMQFSAYEIG